VILGQSARGIDPLELWPNEAFRSILGSHSENKTLPSLRPLASALTRGSFTTHSRECLTIQGFAQFSRCSHRTKTGRSSCFPAAYVRAVRSVRRGALASCRRESDSSGCPADVRLVGDAVAELPPCPLRRSMRTAPGNVTVAWRPRARADCGGGGDAGNICFRQVSRGRGKYCFFSGAHAIFTKGFWHAIPTIKSLAKDRLSALQWGRDHRNGKYFDRAIYAMTGGWPLQ